MSSPAIASATAYPNARSARSSSVGARLVSTPSRAISGPRNAVESRSSIPLSRSTSATPPIRPSVFFDFSRISTPINARSGTMSANSFVCFTCPAITARVTPASCSRLMHFPSCPNEIQCIGAAGGRRARSSSSGNVSSFSAMTVTSCPAPRAASSTRKGNRPFPAMRPRRMSRPL